MNHNPKAEVSGRRIKAIGLEKKDIAWMKDSACQNLKLGDTHEVFYDEDDTGPAMEYCNDCFTSNLCLELGMVHAPGCNNDEYGVWGGTTPKERRQARTARKRKTKLNGLNRELIELEAKKSTKTNAQKIEKLEDKIKRLGKTVEIDTIDDTRLEMPRGRLA